MTPVDVLRQAYAVGLSVTIAPSGNLLASPAQLLTPDMRALLVANKPELLEFLREAEHTTAAVIEAAMRACDHYCDSPEAREEMRRDVLGTPLHLRADLLAHFRQNYGRGQA